MLAEDLAAFVGALRRIETSGARRTGRGVPLADRDAPARERYRVAAGIDAATWARGRGWALSVALIQLPYYRTTNPPLAVNSRHVIRTVLGEIAT
ncbi:MAG TPA: hypothetical protein VG756_31730 [Pseudonocardiaceae bacterium]|nr:hypothetical protein [Pseudonocardiaceae bacterium]